MPRFGNEARDGRSERSTGTRSDGTEDVASGVSSNTRQMSFRGARPEPCFDRALISERQRGGDLMAFNLTRGDTRPILIGLAIAALLGWGLFIYAELHGAAQNQKARQQISRLSTSEESFKTQLAQQQQASGSLADRVQGFERDVILAELKRNGNHITNTAKALGLERSHLYKKAEQVGIDLSALRQGSG